MTILAMASAAHAQTTESSAPSSASHETVGAAKDAAPSQDASDTAAKAAEESKAAARKSFLETLCAPFSQKEDPDGPINTDRPTFTPAHTVVPLGRFQVESGFTYNATRAGAVHTSLYDYPELAVRIGIAKRVEFRTFWLGETDTWSDARRLGRRPTVGGFSDMEFGFKWQLMTGDSKRKWLPSTALITSAIAPTAGHSALSSQQPEPYINLIYNWSLTEKLSLCCSTGYLGVRQEPPDGSRGMADSFSRFHQSLVAFYAATKRTTLFYEWYVFTFTSAVDDRPLHFMDGGWIYLLTPNMQVDLRAGFGLSGRPDDFFSGAGFSFRF
jgi:hypothetical protein